MPKDGSFSVSQRRTKPPTSELTTSFDVLRPSSLFPSSPLRALHLQARAGVRSGKAVKAPRNVVVAAVTEPETATPEAPKPKPKRKFVKKNITVQDADIAVGNEYKGVVVSDDDAMRKRATPREHRPRRETTTRPVDGERVGRVDRGARRTLRFIISPFVPSETTTHV